MSQRRRLRELLAADETVTAPGVYDGMSARLVEQAGFDATIITGAGMAASMLGMPDVGLVSLTESLNQTRNIARCVSIPVIADCDTGYGNPVNVQRTIREFESTDIAALFIEDQVSPKRCGHFAGKQIISTDAMAQKLRAAVDARRDPELLLIARTDARAVEGIEGAVRRGRAYVEAGAEMLFVEAPVDEAELAYVGRELASVAPLMVNLVEGGKTPLLPAKDLGELGFSLVTYSGSLQKTALKAMQGLLTSLRSTGDVAEYYPSRMVSLEERSAVLGLPQFYELERRYASE